MTRAAPALWEIALVLGSLTALGPLATDLYLPALPAMEEALATDSAGVQLTLIAYFAGFGLAQLVWGPMADRLGRRPVLLAGAAVFVVASIGCALAPGVASLITLRLVQAAGAAALMVVPRAVVTDLYDDAEAAKLMGVIMVITAASPLLAPLSGSGLLAMMAWRGIFWVLAGLGIAAFVITLLLLPESTRELRKPTAGAVLRRSREMLGDGAFLRPALTGGFGFAAFAILIVAAPFVFTETYGLSPTQFALAFAAIAFGFVVAAGGGGALTDKQGATRTVTLGLNLYVAAALGALVLALLGPPPLWLAIASLFALTAGLGLVVPISTVLALAPQGGEGGLASSVLGALQMVVGGAAAALLGLVAAPGSLAWMAGGLLVAAVSARLIFRGSRDHAGITEANPEVSDP
ncbi:multidrug effflux MFS transporter [Pseudaestuariivita sp.]|uniref:multidrug effflux MFS transporter n=1 Tax=Pseudaestuariivita sp. TaxID=2211669 RepID=UPI0040594203